MDPRVVTAHIHRAWFRLGVGFALFGTGWALVPHPKTPVPLLSLLEWRCDQRKALRIILAHDKIDHAVGFALSKKVFEPDRAQKPDPTAPTPGLTAAPLRRPMTAG